MAKFPRLLISLAKVTHNAQIANSSCASLGIEIFGVTKGVLGMPEVGEAMLLGGVGGLADSRLLNLKQLAKLKRKRDFKLMLLRQPMEDEAEEVLKLADISLVSEVEIVKLISEKAKSLKEKHQVILMIETGDLREGVLREEAVKRAEEIEKLSYVKLAGVGTNVACLKEAFPNFSNLKYLVEVAEEIEEAIGRRLDIISGGNSSAWKLIEKGEIPQRINQLRIGEAILLGQETVNYEPVSSAYQDAFIIEAEVLETKLVSCNGRKRKLAVLALGIQDIGAGFVKPYLNGALVLKVSSDHLVMDVTECKEQVSAGKIIKFIPSYFALLASVTSPFVNKVFV